MGARPINEITGVKKPSSVLVRGDSAMDIAKQIGAIPAWYSMADFVNWLQGPAGPSVYDLWVAQPGNAGKTVDDYFNFLGLAQAMQAGLALDQLGLDVVALAQANAAVEDAASALAAAAAVDTSGLATKASPALTGTVDVQEAFKFSGDQTPTPFAANTNDWVPANFATRTVLRASSDAARDVTGLAGGADGRLVLLHNIGNNPFTLKHENAGSTAANRFWIGSADGATLIQDLVIRPGRSHWLWYDSTISRWRPLFQGLKATQAQIRAGTDDEAFVTSKQLTDSAAWVPSAGGEIVGTTVTFDMSLGYNRQHTLSANTTFAAPTNLKDGQTYQWLFIQDGAGGRTHTFNAIWQFGGAGAPAPITTANKYNMIVGTYHAALGKIISNFWTGA